jgi:hypothetical protein
MGVWCTIFRAWLVFANPVIIFTFIVHFIRNKTANYSIHEYN